MTGAYRTGRRLLLLLIPLSLTFGCKFGGRAGCLVFGGGHAETAPSPPPPKFDLGVRAWQLFRDQAASSPTNAEQKVAVWDKFKQEFIDAINTIVPQELVGQLPLGVKSLFPLVDDGTLPKTTDAIATILELLYSDPADPDKRALQGLLEVLQPQKRILDIDALISFIGRFLNHPQVDDLIKALGQLIHENDGAGDDGEPNGERDLITDIFKFLSAKLAQEPSPNAQPEGFQNGIDLLLSAQEVPSSVDFGVPSWVVRLDANNNPEVAVDPNTGKIYAPFVDQDGDGAADVNENGDPIDANGEVVAIPAFSKEGTRDAYDRALASDGKLLYVYYDAKRTALSVLLMFLGDLMKAGAHLDLRPVLASVLGTPVLSDNGTLNDPTDDFEQFNPVRNPLIDLPWGLLEILRGEPVAHFFNSLGDVPIGSTRTIQRLILYLGKILQAFQAEGFLANEQDWFSLLNLIEGFQPILDGIFEKPNASSQSTARLLMDIAGDLGNTQPEVFADFALMIQYRNLDYTDTPNGPVLNTTASIPVDYTQPMYIGNVDNRSIVEKVISLLVSLDGPKIPLAGKNLAEMAIESIASGNGDGLLLDALLGAINIPITESIAVPLLNLLGYEGQKVWDNLEVLNSLQGSGSIEGAEKVLKVFVDQNQVNLVIQIFHVLESDLLRDLDNDPNTYSLLRRAEPPLLQVLNSTVPQNVVKVLNNLVQVPGGGATSGADLLADALAYLLDDDVPVYRRDGTLAPSRLHLLTDPFRSFLSRTVSGGSFAAFNHLLKTTVNLISETAINDNGTPGDPADDFEELVRPGLASLFNALASFGGQGLNAPGQDLGAFVTEQQQEIERFIAGKALPMFMALWEGLEASPSAPGFHAALQSLFLPNAEAVYLDAFGALVGLVAQMLEKKGETEFTRDLQLFASRMLDQGNGYIVDVIIGLKAIVQADFTETILQLLRNLFWQGEDGTKKAPASTLLELLQELAKIDGKFVPPIAESAPLTLEKLQQTLEEAVYFLRDNTQNGLPRIYQLIKDRNK